MTTRRKMKSSGIPWLGDVPEDWHLVKGKYCLRQISRPPKDDDGVITCFRDGEVTLRSKRREEGFTVSLKEFGYQGIEPGDLVVHGMDGFAGSIGISDSRGKASPVLVVLDSEQEKRYLMYYLRSVAYKDVFVGLATGIRVRSCDLRWNKLAELPYLLPPLHEQRVIAGYLNGVGARIDGLKTKMASEIELLEAYKRSFIVEAVAGRFTGKATRKMKPSGIPWLGDVPEEWEVTRLKWHLEEVNELNSPIKSNFILSLTNDRGVIPYSEKGNQGNKAKEDISGYKLAYRDCIIANSMNIIIGSVGLSEYDGCVSPVYYVFRAKGDTDIRFINYIFQTSVFQRELRKHAKGILEIRLRISAVTILAQKIALPPLAEQREIAAMIDRRIAAIDAVIAKRKVERERLDALKKSIICEAVTGRKEIR